MIGIKFEGKSRVKPVLVYSAIIVIIVLAVLNGYQAFRIAHVKEWADLSSFLASGSAMFEGTNPYDTDAHWQYLYPLTLASLIIPLTFLPQMIVTFVWFLLSLYCLLHSIYIMQDLLGTAKQNIVYMYIATMLLFASIIQSDLMYGQINSIILLLMIGSIAHLKKKKFKGTALLAFAASIKIMPIVLLPFVLKSGVKQLGLYVLLVVVFVLLLPYAIAGDAMFQYYSWWFDSIILDQVRSGDTPANSFTLAGGIAAALDWSSTPFVLKAVCGLFLLYFPINLLIRHKNYYSAMLLAIALIPLTGTKSETHHLVFLIPASMLIYSSILKQKFLFDTSTVKRQTLAWILVLISQLLVLWGKSAGQFALDAVGILLLFFTAYYVSLSRDPKSIG